jgi:ferredoxin
MPGLYLTALEREYYSARPSPSRFASPGERTMPKIKFVKEKKEIEVPAGTNLREAMMENGITVYKGLDQQLNCRGHGLCATCRVYIKEGFDHAASPTLIEKMRTGLSFYAIGHEHEVRLSCQTKVMGDMSVESTPDFNWFGEPVKYITRDAGE